MIVSKLRIINFFNKIKFKCIVLFRRIILLFKWDKSIQLIELNFHDKYIFEKSFFAIQYKFKNALWYEFKGIKTTTNNSIALFNRELINSPIHLIIHGLFNKVEYVIDTSYDTTFNTTSFTTKLNNLSSYNYNSKDIRLSLSEPFFQLKNISFQLNPEIQIKNIKLRHTPFNKADYFQNNNLNNNIKPNQ